MSTVNIDASASEGPVATPPMSITLILVGLMLGMILASLDQTIVATALPTIAGDLNGLNHLSWVVTAYLLASTVSTPLWGKLGDQFGRKNFFIAAIIIFLIGSALSGLSRSMFELIAFRAIQGLGGGGLMIGAQAIIADVVSPRERGKYQGYFGAVFGLTSVAGPLIGGFFVQNLSWRWVFYVNIPLGLIALAVISAVLKLPKSTIPHRIDYAGSALLATGVTCLVLVTTWGGSEYAWGSVEIIGLSIAAVIFLTALIFVEQQAAEPVLPLKLFNNRIFVVCCTVGLAIGFALFGVVTFLPLFLQVAQNASPTESGLQLLPLMSGVLIASIGSGQLISKFGRYKMYPIVGTGLMTLGLFLLSLMTATTSIVVASLYMAVLGLGLGFVIQVLVLAVQNAVDTGDIGTATSAATFFRSIGGSFGVALFGVIFNSALATNLVKQVPAGGQRDALAAGGSQINPESLAKLSPAIREGYNTAFADSMSTVFQWAIPFAIAAFVLTWFLKEIPLRTTSAVGAGTPEEVAQPPINVQLQTTPYDGRVSQSLENVGASFGLDPRGRSAVQAEARSRIRAIRAALDQLDKISATNGLAPEHTTALRDRYYQRLKALELSEEFVETPDAGDMPDAFWTTVEALIHAERAELYSLAANNELSPAVRHRVASDLANTTESEDLADS